MAVPQDLSRAERLLAGHPDARARALRSEDFKRWMQTFSELLVDDKRMYVERGRPMQSGGDTLLDEAEAIVSWAREIVTKDGAAAPSAAKEIRQLDAGAGEVKR